MLKNTADEKQRDGGAKKEKIGDSVVPSKQPINTEPAYRSQKEVNDAFKKRLASLMEKWEQEQKEKEKERSEQAQAMQLMQHIESGAKDFFEIYPDVDLAVALNDDPLFAYLLMKGKGLIETYAFLYDNKADGRLRRQVEQEILSNLKARNIRPHTLPAANSGGTSKDIARLSDAEILRIDSRTKNGERVTL